MMTGKFINAAGEKIEPPAEPGAAYPILCGPWPNQNAGAIRRMCSVCADPVGLSPEGLALHEEMPSLRPTLCRVCFWMLAVMMAEAEGSRNG